MLDFQCLSHEGEEKHVILKGNSDRVSFAIEAPPVFGLSHLADEVALLFLFSLRTESF